MREYKYVDVTQKRAIEQLFCFLIAINMDLNKLIFNYLNNNMREMVIVTTSLSDASVEFLRTTAKEKGIRQNTILEESLALYKQKLIEDQVRQWFEDRKNEYMNTASDFSAIQFNSLSE